jgi:undecaprenol kinase/diacylglycerol kinase (ATP)
MVVVAGWHFSISVAEWLAIVLCVGAVLVTELINTAIETLVDMVSPEFNVKAGLVKDIAAAAVLIAAIMAVIVALIIFVPKM